MLYAFFALAFGISWRILALYVLLTERASALFGEMGYTKPTVHSCGVCTGDFGRVRRHLPAWAARPESVCTTPDLALVLAAVAVLLSLPAMWCAWAWPGRSLALHRPASQP